MTTQQEAIAKARKGLEISVYVMETYNWNCNSIISNDMKRKAYKLNKEALAALDSIKPTPMPEAIAKAITALKAYQHAGFGNSTDYFKQGEAYDLGCEALAALDAIPITNSEPISSKLVDAVKEPNKSKYSDVVSDGGFDPRNAVKEPEPVGAIEHDADMDRYYIPVHPKWEIQTQGKGSSFRIANTETGRRMLVADKFLHKFIEDMARDINALYTAPPMQKEPEPVGWQPIDGNTHGYKGPILICDDRGIVSQNHSNWISNGLCSETRTGEQYPAYEGTLRDGYTQWMPLPAPPSEVKL